MITFSVLSSWPFLGPRGIKAIPPRNLGFAFSTVELSYAVGFDRNIKGFGLSSAVKVKFLPPLRAMEESRTASFVQGKGDESYAGGLESAKKDDCGCGPGPSGIVLQLELGINGVVMSTVGKSTNIVWQECSVSKLDRQKLLGQKGCVLWITGLSGSGKSTLACALSQVLHRRGKMTYILDGDNVRHGLNRDLGFKAEDREENIRRIGEVAKLFADAGIICIASLISPYRRDRDACRALLPDLGFIEVSASHSSISLTGFMIVSLFILSMGEQKYLVLKIFMNVPLEVCEARDAKGLYKLARAGKIKGFTGIDDPYEPPLNCEIEIHEENGVLASPGAMAEQVMSYLEDKGFLQA
ncbi:Adenylyl-sulfate kinase 2, chloroplastic [Asimina triloba]